MGIVLLVALAFVLLGVIGAAVGIYNHLVQLHFNIDKAWANIDVILKQRRDELPKLVDTCKGYMKYEQALLEKITAARSAFLSASTPDERVKAENEISRALKSLFAVAENYPDLKANQGFFQLQGRISSLESGIADRRELFNESVNLYNIKIHQFPDLLLARMMGYAKRQLLEIPSAETSDPKIDL